MSEVLNISQLVVDELKEYNAELFYFPDFELRDLDKMQIAVVPSGTEYKTVSRSVHEEMPKVQIGVLKRCTEDELDGMLQFVEKLGLGFLNKKLGGATCVAVVYNPIYSAEHLRERGQFTSVIELTFKILKQ